MIFTTVDSFHSFATECKSESHKKICENNDLYNTLLPFQDTKIIESNKYQRSNKEPFII